MAPIRTVEFSIRIQRALMICTARGSRGAAIRCVVSYHSSLLPRASHLYVWLRCHICMVSLPCVSLVVASVGFFCSRCGEKLWLDCWRQLLFRSCIREDQIWFPGFNKAGRRCYNIDPEWCDAAWKRCCLAYSIGPCHVPPPHRILCLFPTETVWIVIVKWERCCMMHVVYLLACCWN